MNVWLLLLHQLRGRGRSYGAPDVIVGAAFAAKLTISEARMHFAIA
jgi:hypothetical protein